MSQNKVDVERGKVKAVLRSVMRCDYAAIRGTASHDGTLNTYRLALGLLERWCGSTGWPHVSLPWVLAVDVRFVGPSQISQGRVGSAEKRVGDERSQHCGHFSRDRCTRC